MEPGRLSGVTMPIPKTAQDVPEVITPLEQPTNPFLEAALALAGQGLRVFPLKPRNKAPLTAHGFRDAVSDETQIQAWWAEWPNANVGLRTGYDPERGVGIAVLDVDPRGGGTEALATLFAEYGTPSESRRVETGGGGEHRYFPLNGPLASWNSGTGLELKADGAYVVVPPSIHPSGRAYAGVSPSTDRPGEPLPEWLRQMGRGANGRAAPIADRIPEGSRRPTLTSLAGSMRRRGMGEREIAAALLVTNDQRCDPPLAEEDVRRIAVSVATLYEPAEGGTVVGTSGRRENRAATPLTLSELIYGAGELLTRTLPEQRWAIPGLLPEGLSMLVGKPKMGKSWMALDIALAVATGGSVLGEQTEQGDVLYLALEDNPRRLQDRMAKLLAPVAGVNGRTGSYDAKTDTFSFDFNLSGLVTPTRLELANRWPRMTDDGEGGLRLLDEWLKGRPDARLVVVDTLARVKPRAGRGNAYEEDYAALSPLQELAMRHGVTVLVLSHFRKQEAEDPLETITGSMGSSATLDGALLLQRHRGRADAVLTVIGRDMKEDAKELPLTWNADTARWSVSGDAAENRLSDERLEVLQVLQQAGGTLTAGAVGEILGKPRGTVKRLLWNLSQDGLVESGSRGYSVVANPTNHPNHPDPYEPYEPSQGGSPSGAGDRPGTGGSGGSGGSPVPPGVVGSEWMTGRPEPSNRVPAVSAPNPFAQ